MTYEERVQYHETRALIGDLRTELEAGDPDAALTRREALAMLSLLEGIAERLSPERWDRSLEAIADEAARRADILAARRN